MLEEIKKTINNVLKNQELISKYKAQKLPTNLFQANLNLQLWKLANYQQFYDNLLQQALNELNVVILPNSKLEKFNPINHEKIAEC